MLEIISYGFMQRALLTGAVLSLFSGIISVFIVLRRISFLGSGISHAAFGGVSIGFLLGINPLLTALVYSVVMAFGIEQISSKGRLAEDTAIGIFFSSSMALGIVLIGLSSSYNVDLFGYLFGSILAITDEDALIAVFTTLVLMGVLTLIIKKLYFITFNEELAFVSGIKVRLIKSIFLLTMAVAIVIGIKLVGIILISALLVIPGAAAQMLTKRFYKMIIVSCFISMFSAIAGIIISYRFNLASGGTIVILLATIFFVAFFSKILKNT
ncbi:manganese ABC transporter permease [Dissulfurispira thermophila]|uniref:Manganese ABC transporter permease n=2 Tax=root TaxID=1 RepID=A0A7G1GZL9_9BACT|nr:metal ABC transporter permease [Dissulfurispira thermophila]BCB95834.1 manganese ABC transporter permease [Dissulfurispira thermophila]